MPEIENKTPASNDQTPVVQAASPDSVPLTRAELNSALQSFAAKLDQRFGADHNSQSSQGKGGKNQKPASQNPEYIALRAEIDKDRMEAANERRDLAVSQALAGLGVAPEYADILISDVMRKHGEKLKVEGRTVYAEGPLEARLPVQEYLKSAYGAQLEKFQVAKPLPGAKPRSGNTGNFGTTNEKHPFSELDFLTIMATAKNKPQDLATYMANNREEYEAKKNAARNAARK